MPYWDSELLSSGTHCQRFERVLSNVAWTESDIIRLVGRLNRLSLVMRTDPTFIKPPLVKKRDTLPGCRIHPTRKRVGFLLVTAVTRHSGLQSLRLRSRISRVISTAISSRFSSETSSSASIPRPADGVDFLTLIPSSVSSHRGSSPLVMPKESRSRFGIVTCPFRVTRVVGSALSPPSSVSSVLTSSTIRCSS